MNTFKRLVEEEVRRVRSRGHRCAGWHEAYGLLAEEFDEFWDEVKKRPGKRNPENSLHELVQIAGLCERAAIDLKLIEEYKRTNQNPNVLTQILLPKERIP